MLDVHLVSAGALTGFLVGLTGVGGGALMTPLLILLFGVAPISAVGTDLWFAAITKTLAAYIHHDRDLIDWPVVYRLWCGSLPASLASLVFLHWFSVAAELVHFLKYGVAITILVTAVGMLLHSRLHSLGTRFRLGDASTFKQLQTPLTILAGLILGILVTITSIGAGALGAVFLCYLYPLRLTPQRLVATDIAHAIPLALFAGVGHLIIGNVNFALLFTLLLGSLPAVWLGVRLSSFLPQKWLRTILGCVLGIIAVQMLKIGYHHA